ncbi:hypothetical protein EW146_g5113 [Bondarzewia mesenterica]|uniref:Uncharacterized protein n=1 Tax=Bondarzewia mesenterica TaxID=1095465 RepID=A0A4S4LUI4_9AGAM|nr:hypothetical protein EW146_g5113 [Bondarzewia mesenterica]
MSTDNTNNKNNTFKPSNPIPIGGNSPTHRGRAPSLSTSDGSPTSPQSIKTPLDRSPPRISTSSTSPSTSPLFSYFMSTSPTKPNGTFPFRRTAPGLGAAPPVIQDDDGFDASVPHTFNGRRANSAWAGNARLAKQASSPPTMPIPEVQQAQQQRGSGVLRRLSLGSGFTRPILTSMRPHSPLQPNTPPSSAVSPPASNELPSATPARKARRATTIAGRPNDLKRRAPSPMGERILKGHFDGFN